MPDDAATWTQPRSEAIDILLAEWVLRRLPSEAVPDLAVQALQDGCESSAVAILTGLTRPTRADVDDELAALLHELGRSRPTEPEALKRLVDECAMRIVAGTLDPAAGAERIRELWARHDHPDGHLEAWIDVRPFLNAARESENGGPDVDARAADIVEESGALLSRGGLNISSRLGPGQLDGRVIGESRLQEHVAEDVRLPLRLGLTFEDGLSVTLACATDGPCYAPTIWPRTDASKSVVNGSHATFFHPA